MDISKKSSSGTRLTGMKKVEFPPYQISMVNIPHNKTSQELMDGAWRHIQKFPTMDSYYTRDDTNRNFLGSDLNINRMYDLYNEECHSNCEM